MWKGGLGRKGTGNRFGREIRVSEGYSNLNALYMYDIVKEPTPECY